MDQVGDQAAVGDLTRQGPVERHISDRPQSDHDRLRTWETRRKQIPQEGLLEKSKNRKRQPFTFKHKISYHKIFFNLNQEG